MRNRTADLLLTMETLCRLSYRGNADKLSKKTALIQGGKAELQVKPITPAIRRRLGKPNQWRVQDSNLRSLQRLIYSQFPLAARETRLAASGKYRIAAR